MGLDVTFNQNTKSYINSHLCYEYINNGFLPYVADLTHLEEFAQQKDIIMMDNCIVHFHEVSLKLFAQRKVNMITVA